MDVEFSELVATILEMVGARVDRDVITTAPT